MAISVFGWGAGAITTAGFGYGYSEWISILLAEYLENLYVYTCILTRDYVEVLVRETGEVVLRFKPEQIPQRGYGEILSRMREGDLLLRTKPDQIPDRNYTEIVQRLKDGDVILRVRPDQIPVRERGEIMSRIRAEDVLVRSKGWPWQGDICLDDEI